MTIEPAQMYAILQCPNCGNGQLILDRATHEWGCNACPGRWPIQAPEAERDPVGTPFVDVEKGSTVLVVDTPAWDGVSRWMILEHVAETDTMKSAHKCADRTGKPVKVVRLYEGADPIEIMVEPDLQAAWRGVTS